MATSAVRVLVVDDFESFRRFVSSTLQKNPELQVICEASDGLEAVQKAEELHPDLIVLDIGLPKRHGIEAAQEIRELSPQSRILFLSQESSADVVRKVFSVGASGYVVKADAESELLTAVNTVLRGERFVGSRFAGHDFADASDSQASHGLRRNEILASPAPTWPRTAERTRRHEAEFYSDDASFLDSFTQFIRVALKAGHAAIVVATESHRDSLLRRLRAHGLDIGAAIEQGRYISLDSAETLSTFIVNDLPDPVRFMKVVGDLITKAAKTENGKLPHVAVCGECSPVLWAQGKGEAAIRLESLWDEMAKTYDVDILCGYQWKTLDCEEDSHVFERICAEHSAVRSP
jgi:DNA-binding NarL/FixJ family response regulator